MPWICCRAATRQWAVSSFCLAVGCLQDRLPGGEGTGKRAEISQTKERKANKQDGLTIITDPSFFWLLSCAARWAGSSPRQLLSARALAAGPVNRAPAGQTRVARGEKGRGVGRSRRDENTTRVAITANCTPARRPIPSARVRSIAALGELRFRRRYATIDSTISHNIYRRCCNASVVWLRPIDPG